ncbi:MAG: hypothetical protein ACFFCW_14945 [Candidatus Hodarchaeota archaeon]
MEAHTRKLAWRERREEQVYESVHNLKRPVVFRATSCSRLAQTTARPVNNRLRKSTKTESLGIRKVVGELELAIP